MKSPLRAWCALVFMSGLLASPNLQGAVVINEIMYHPASENVLEEFVELYNNGPTNANLAGWQFSKGVQFSFPNLTLPAGGYLAVAANVATFTNKYPGVTNVVGGWTGHLSNSRNDLDLDDAQSNRVDSVVYADEGDWAVRTRAPLDHNHRGWTWQTEHDGVGKSAELINPNLSNNYGQNWAPSTVTNGTPGAPNSVLQTNVAPLIADVQSLPVIPRSIDAVLVTARLLDERTSNLTATVHWRIADTNLSFASLSMFDDGLHNDGSANDGVFAATLPAQTNNAIVEFYIAALDQEGHARTWPAPAVETNGASLGQAANVLYQVDDSSYSGTFPLYKLVMRDLDRAELALIGSASNGDQDSDAEMNGTFISIDGTGTEARYPIGIRNRGHGSRRLKPNNYRISFNADNLWKGVTALNLNGQFTHAQLIGAVLSLKAGLGGANSRPVQVRVNNLNLGTNSPVSPASGSKMFGTIYVANETVNSDWAEHWYPADSSGNVYRAIRDISPPNFSYRGTNADAYTNTWFKNSNTSENDWTDLIAMLRVMGTNDLFTSPSIHDVIHTGQWLTYAAVMTLFNNKETSPNTGNNDDYFFYAGAADRRFHLMYYDLDTILGEGGTFGTTNDTLFGAANPTATFNLSNFMHSAEFEPIYYRTLQRLLDTTFSKNEFDSTLDQTLADFVPATAIARMKTWMDGRRAFVQSLVTPYLATNPIAPIAIISGEPRSPSPFASASLTISGAGVTQYRYRLNNASFGATNTVATPITLTNLAQGSTNTVFVIAAGASGPWQADSNATVSRTWIVNTNLPAVRINEVLAKNLTVSNHFSTLPDLVELFNEGSTSVNLSGLRLTDKITSPGKFTFPNGTTLAAGNYLVLLANNTDGTPGTHLGFSFDDQGEGLFLFDKASSGGALLDSVEFGLQLPDLSLGRIGGSGEFVLTQPTFGTNNLVRALGDPRGLRINEWLASEFALTGPDFIEIYNTNALPVAMGGLYFTDNPISVPTKHTVAPLSFIGAHDFRVFKADNDTNQGFDHLSFKLPAEQGLIALLATDLSLIDCVLYGPQSSDVAQGRSPDGANGIIFLPTPTPGAANPGSLACTVTATNLALMSLASVWKYDQTNNLDGVNWTATNYNDSAWPSGPGLLAFENNAAITPLINTILADPRTPTNGLGAGHGYYFRTTLNLSNDLTGFTVTASAYIDDGAIVYVNGNEVTPRIRMAAGLVTNASFASSQPPNSGEATVPDTFTIPASMFIHGANVIAVEVHQTGATSTDIVWGMALDAAAQLTNCGQSGVVINEVFASNQSLTNAAGRTPDWLELYNAGTNTIDLGDMSLSNTTGVPRKWIFAASTLLAPAGRLVVEFDDGVPASAINTGFALKSTGDAVYLFQRPANGGAVLDSVIFGLQAADFSIGRIPDGTGGWALTLPTRGTANVAAGPGNASSLKINEWLAASSHGNDWLELYNPDSQPIEVSALSLTDNASQRNQSPFPPLSFIGPGSYQKLIVDGNQGNGADHVNFNLNAGGGFIGLYWPIGTQIDAISYTLQTADVSQGRFPDGAPNVLSFAGTASPGAPNYLLLSNLVINELVSHTDPPLEDAVELLNLSSNAVDISGWYLSNTKDALQKYLVPSNTIVAAGGYHVFYEYQFGTNTSPDAIIPFNFNSAHGDEVHLSQTNGSGGLSGYRARSAFGAAANGVSFGRFLTSAGEEFVAMSHRSFGMDTPATLAQFRTGSGAANPYALVGPIVFSEINYRPTDSYNGDTNAAEFIELLNITTNTVLLFDPEATTNRWQISGGINFTFPASATLAAGQALLLVSFDPVADPTQLSWFRAACQVATNVAVFGPYSGALANEGDDLELLKPDAPQLPPHPDAGFVPYVLVEHVHYLPSPPWPTNGVGSGASLQRAVPANFGNEPLNWFSAAPSAGLGANDSDGDGLPDYWESANGLNPNDASGANGANGDLDGDGQTNLQEFLAGTRPNDSGDYLRIVSLDLNSGAVKIQFRTAVGHSYSVLYSDASPRGPWQKLADVPIAISSMVVEIPDQAPNPSHRFYRLVTPANP